MAEVQIIALVASERVEEKIYHLVGKGGETPADPRIAADVAEKLLELRAPAVCGIYPLLASRLATSLPKQEAPMACGSLLVFACNEGLGSEPSAAQPLSPRCLMVSLPYSGVSFR
jgi:hypothetical protein